MIEMGVLKLKLTIAYDGFQYKGWQVQKSGITVQQKIEEALQKLFPSVDRDFQLVKKYGCSIAYTRPSVVFGYGRQNTAINWAEDFAAKPALGEIGFITYNCSLQFRENNI